MQPDNIPTRVSLVDELPKENFFEKFDLYQWEGFWYRPKHLEAAFAFRSQFEAKNDDIILASAMKTGSTWLKALCFSIMQRPPYRSTSTDLEGKEKEEKEEKKEVEVEVEKVVKEEEVVKEEKEEKKEVEVEVEKVVKEEEEEDLLAKNHPAHHVQTLEVQVFTSNPPQLDVSGMPSPRLFHTHLPFKALPECIKNNSSSSPDQCKIVYITRNPKDTIVSMWHFLNNLRTPEQGPYPLEKAFESFCDGVYHFGPFFDHVLEYWNESLKMPHKILFLKYEDMKREPNVEVKKLAAFLGRPFEEEKEVEEVIRRCSLERLKNLEVNKNGIDPWVGMPNSAFFRSGIVGGWKQLLTEEMSDRLDQIALTKLEGSVLTFDYE